MKKLMRILMLSCKKSTELIEKKMYFSLSFLEKIQLALHTGMCDACKSWEKQSSNMDIVLKKHFHKKAEDTDHSHQPLSQDAMERILKKIKESD